jgi:hypothetical protein
MRITVGGCLLAIGGTLLLAAPAHAQWATHHCPAGHDSVADGAFAGFAKGLPHPPCSEPSLPPGRVTPLESAKRSDYAAPAGPPLIADLHVAATQLGFEPGVGPAPGHSISYRGHKYRVTDVEVKGGGPSLSGGSDFVIGIEGSTLLIGLKSIVPGGLLDPDRFEVSVVN